MDSSKPATAPSPEKCRVDLSGVTETLLIPLKARASDAQSSKPILGDIYAQDIMDRLDHDFDKVPLTMNESSAIALRTRFLDSLTTSFLSRHSSATILHLGCGLDSRAQRVDWSGGDVCWVDVDLPPALTLRQSVVPTIISDRDYRMVSADVTSDSSWLEGIPKDRPVGVIMEGLVSYLTEEERAVLLLNLVENFEEGEIFFDCISPLLLNAGVHKRIEAVRQTGAEFRSAIDDPSKLENLHSRLQYVDAVRYVEVSGVEELPLAYRFHMYLLSWIPGFRDSARLVHYRILRR